uniref:Alpha 1,3-galactosyltransferase 2 n=1 Tax=Cynoglossus semilaevis TaxID=244447 RepID=A0A3P8UKV8_CYNSE
MDTRPRLSFTRKNLYLGVQCIYIELGLMPVTNNHFILFVSTNLILTITSACYFHFRTRPDVLTNTPWNAPIIWEGVFDPYVSDQFHIRLNSSVALTVFAVGRFTFLVSAERHFMLGLRVTYYVFTDNPEKVPELELGPQRNMKVIEVAKYTRWQDISMMRMRTISVTIESEIRHSFQYVFCFDVDQEFKGRFGSEALGDSVALLHAHYYNLPKHRFTYDRNPKSKAFMYTGDFYYHAAIFGGRWKNVKNLTDECLENIMEDKLNQVEALWHDESHLNKYFWLHKPTKLLSPEYCWDETLPAKDILIIRMLWSHQAISNQIDITV